MRGPVQAEDFQSRIAFGPRMDWTVVPVFSKLVVALVVGLEEIGCKCRPADQYWAMQDFQWQSVVHVVYIAAAGLHRSRWTEVFHTVPVDWIPCRSFLRHPTGHSSSH